jgi:hypothetical protein
MSVNAAINHDKLVRVDPGFTQSVIGNQRQVAGYPLYGYWARRSHYNDVNHDGILGYTEVSVADSATYVGSSLPTQEASLSTHIGLLQNLFTVGAVFSYAGGYKVQDQNAVYADCALTSSVANDPHAPLPLQARAIAAAAYTGCNPVAAYFEDGTFIRFRELTLTYALPTAWARAIHARSISLTGAVRNLALWSRFPGADPEVSNPAAVTGSNLPASQRSVNNDIRANGPSAVPLARSWFTRINIGW